MTNRDVEKSACLSDAYVDNKAMVTSESSHQRNVAAHTDVSRDRTFLPMNGFPEGWHVCFHIRLEWNVHLRTLAHKPLRRQKIFEFYRYLLPDDVKELG